MARKTCSSCGAINATDATKCRLCGHVFGLYGEMPDKPVDKPRGAVSDKPKWGVLPLALVGVGILSVLAGITIYLGLIRSEEASRAQDIAVIRMSPNINGWSEVSPEGSGIVVGLPSAEITTTNISMQGLFGGERLAWVGKFDESSSVTFIWGKTVVPVSDSPVATLESASNAFAADLGGSVKELEMTSVGSRDAVTFEIARRGTPEYFTRALMVVDADTIWVVYNDTKNESFPLFQPMVDQFRFSQ